jgi:hypothetical protein
MKCRDFSAALGALADVLYTAGAPVARDQIAMFATVFDACPSSSVSDLTNRLAALRGDQSTGSLSLGNSLGDVARLLSVLKGFLEKVAKGAVLADIAAVEKLLQDHATMELRAFVRSATEAAASRRPARKPAAPQVRDDLVLQYKEKLEAALGDEEKFGAVYGDLRANAAIGKSEIMALAKQMTGSSVRTRDAALKKIWNRHQSLVVFDAKSRAMDGRSAA